MIIHPQTPGGYVIYCDDIRQEVTKKFIYLGAYSGEMTAYGESPITLQSLSALIVYRDAPSPIPKQVKIEISKVGTITEIIFVAEVTVPANVTELDFGIEPPSDPDSKFFYEIRLTATFIPFVITEDVTLKTKAYVGDDEVRLGNLRVKIAPASDFPEAIGAATDPISPREEE